MAEIAGGYNCTPGTKLRFRGPTGSWNGDGELQLLTKDSVYEVTEVDVQAWYTDVWLELDHGVERGPFNSCCFETVD